MTIEFTNVDKRFGLVEALENVSLTVRDGEFFSLIGPSGCGKTTMLRIAAGLELPSGGTVLVNSDTPRNACSQHQIGVAFQRPALLASRTALSNVRMTLEITGPAGALSPNELLTDFGLGEFHHHYPHQLSGGMQQRVNIAAHEIAFTGSIIGAIVAEWLFARKGLGYLIVQSMTQYRADRLWAVTMLASALAVGGYLLVKIIERYVFRWQVQDLS